MSIDTMMKWQQTLFSDTPALDDGITGHAGCEKVQIYAGRHTQLTNAFPMTTKGDVGGTLMELIRKSGAPNLLFSDNAKENLSKKVKDILNWYSIDDHQCEPHHQHQNYAERVIQEILRYVQVCMERIGTPPNCWLLCLLYVVELMNHLARKSLGGRTPIEAAFNYKPDVSPYLMSTGGRQSIMVLTTRRSFPAHPKKGWGELLELLGIRET